MGIFQVVYDNIANIARDAWGFMVGLLIIVAMLGGAVATTAMMTPYTLTKTAAPATGSQVVPGQIITYTITVTNGATADTTAGNGFIRMFERLPSDQRCRGLRLDHPGAGTERRAQRRQEAGTAGRLLRMTDAAPMEDRPVGERRPPRPRPIRLEGAFVSRATCCRVAVFSQLKSRPRAPLAATPQPPRSIASASRW